MAELFALEGYAVSCARDGIEALRRLKTEPAPSVIVLDIILPRVDGVTFRRAQLQRAPLRDIPAIALTSLATIGDWRDLRFTEVLKKPVGLDRLMHILAQLCSRA